MKLSCVLLSCCFLVVFITAVVTHAGEETILPLRKDQETLSLPLPIPPKTAVTGSVPNASTNDRDSLFLNNDRSHSVNDIAKTVKGTRLLFKNKGITCLEHLREHEATTHLDLSENHITSLNGIGTMKKLEFLDVGGNPLTDLGDLAELHRLQILVLSIKNAVLQPLESLDALSLLIFVDSTITELSALSGMPNLSTLGLIDCRLENSDCFKELTTLRTLKIINGYYDGCDRKEDVFTEPFAHAAVFPSLSGMRELGVLVINYNQLTSLNFVSGLKNLRYAEFANNALTDTRDLTSLPALYTLILNNNHISDLSSLGDLNALTQIELRNNRVVSVEGLTELKNLQELRIDHNQLDSIAPVANLPALKVLTLDGNRLPLSQLQCIMEVENLLLGTQKEVSLPSLRSPLRMGTEYDIRQECEFNGTKTEFSVFDRNGVALREEIDYRIRNGHISFLRPGECHIEMRNAAIHSRGQIQSGERTTTQSDLRSVYSRGCHALPIDFEGKLLYHGKPITALHPPAIVKTHLLTILD